MSSSIHLPEREVVLIILYELGFIFKPSAVTATTLILLRRYADLWVSTWAISCLALLSLPVVHGLSVWRSNRRVARKAAQMGAVLPPRVQGRWPGGLDLLAKLTDSFENGFLSECLCERPLVDTDTAPCRRFAMGQHAFPQPDFRYLHPLG